MRAIGIERLHLEQDAGKSLHDQSPTQTYVDLNRSGVALMEIVSKPDLRSAEEAGLFVRKVRTILRYLGTCDGNLEQGSLRCDVNISVRHPGDALGCRAPPPFGGRDLLDRLTALVPPGQGDAASSW